MLDFSPNVIRPRYDLRFQQIDVSASKAMRNQCRPTMKNCIWLQLQLQLQNSAPPAASTSGAASAAVLASVPASTSALTLVLAVTESKTLLGVFANDFEVR